MLRAIPFARPSTQSKNFAEHKFAPDLAPPVSIPVHPERRPHYSRGHFPAVGHLSLPRLVADLNRIN